MLLSSSIQAEKIVIMKFTMMMHAMLWREGKMRINVYGAGLNRFAPVGISVNDDVRIFTIIVINEFLCLATVLIHSNLNLKVAFVLKLKKNLQKILSYIYSCTFCPLILFEKTSKCLILQHERSISNFLNFDFSCQKCRIFTILWRKI